MPSSCVCLASKTTSGMLEKLTIERRDVGPTDVFMDIHFCGMCHSDIHQIRAEWPQTNLYPMVPGHELIGVVNSVGSEVTKFKKGDRVGVGCFVDSCGNCPECKQGDEHFCSGPSLGEDNGTQFTYNCLVKGKDVHLKNAGEIDPEGELLHGGYSQNIVVSQDFVVNIPDSLPLQESAPLLCAGITTYSPLVHYGAKAAGKDFTVGIAGFGGLGSMAVKLSLAMGNKVTVLSHSPRKEEAAKALGADFLIFDKKTKETHGRKFDLIIDTISADHDAMALLDLLKCEGALCMVGLPPSAISVHPFLIIPRRLKFGGSMIGSIKETQECLNFCAEHKLMSDVTVIGADKVNQAINMIATGANPTSRYVIDILNTLNDDVVVLPEPECLLANNRGVVHASGKVLPASAIAQ